MPSNSVLETALNLPLFNILRNKRIILASSSPRRIEILKTFGLAPEVIPSTFPETLSHSLFENAGEYCSATSSSKGVDVYQRLVREDDENPPDLVIAADTVVVLSSATSYTILEKPRNIIDQMGMLQDLNGSQASIITAVTLG